MSIRTTRQLQKKETECVKLLLAACRKAGEHLIELPWEDDQTVWLLYEKDGGQGLTAMMALTHYEEGMLSCTALTHPSCRKRGCFSALLMQAESLFPETGFIFFLTDQTRRPLERRREDPADCPALAVLQNLGAERVSRDYLLEKRIQSAVYENGVCLQAEDHARFLSREETDENRLYFSLTAGNAVLASARAELAGGGSAFLHHVLVPEGRRRKGYASQLLSHIFRDLAGRGQQRILLHTADENEAAIGLYSKAGFRITETLTGYLY